jgi:hypothetical protein
VATTILRFATQIFITFTFTDIPVDTNSASQQEESACLAFGARTARKRLKDRFLAHLW